MKGSEVTVYLTGGANKEEQASLSTEKATGGTIGPSNFIIKGLLGKGTFGEVFLVEKKDTGAQYAMKVLEKKKVMGQNIVRYALTERNVLSLVEHPFIVRLNFAFQTKKKLFLILNFYPCGDLGDLLDRKKRLSENVARMYAAEVLLALEELHRRDIIYRDLKPDNLVIDEEGHLALTDFGLSKEGIEGDV